MADRFTVEARSTFTFASEEAKRFNHAYIGTEHLLLGLLRVEDGIAVSVLTSMEISLRKVRDAVEFILGLGDTAVKGDINFTPRSKKVIELAVDEARRLNHSHVGPEHILLGLVREGEGIAAGVLESLGMPLERIRARVLNLTEQITNPITTALMTEERLKSLMRLFLLLSDEDFAKVSAMFEKVKQERSERQTE